MPTAAPPATLPAPPSVTNTHLPSRRRELHGTVQRLGELGPRALSLRELLQMVLDSGRGSEAAERAISGLAGTFTAPEGHLQLRAIGVAGLNEVARAAGVRPAVAARLLAAFELGRRAVEEYIPDRNRLHTARDVYEHVRLRMRDLPQEEFWVLLLNTQCEVTREVRIGRGTVDACLVHPREVFRLAIRDSASSVVLVHNHPSGEPHPSPEDRVITQQLVTAGNLIGIPVDDHVVIGEGRYFSFAETDLLDH